MKMVFFRKAQNGFVVELSSVFSNLSFLNDEVFKVTKFSLLEVITPFFVFTSLFFAKDL